MKSIYIFTRGAAVLLVILFWANDVLSEDMYGVHGQYQGENSDVIDMYTGTLSISQNDLTLPGRNGLDVVVSRSYSSDLNYEIEDDGNLPIAIGAVRPYELLGYGWHFNMPRIYQDTIYYGDGSSEGLFRDYPADPRGRFKTRQYSLVAARADSTTPDTIFNLDGTRMITGPLYHFNTGADLAYAGKFVNKIVDSHGNYITVEYHHNYPFIRYIRDSIGRFIYFDYSTDSSSFGLSTRLTRMRYLNWNGNTVEVSYYYDQTGYYLSKVGYPSGDTLKYSYTDTAYWDGDYEYLNVNRLSLVTLPYGGRISYDWGFWKQWKYNHVDTNEVYRTQICDDSISTDCCEYWCNQQAYSCTCQVFDSWSYTEHDPYVWRANVRSRTRLHDDSSTDSVRFNYNYAEEYCLDDQNWSTILNPDSSFQIFWHSSFRMGPNAPWSCGYDGRDNVLIAVESHENYCQVPLYIGDGDYERAWFVGDWFGFFDGDDIKSIRIGTEIGGNDSITVPAVNYSQSILRGDTVGIPVSRWNFNTHIGTFMVSSSNDVYDSLAGVWDTVSNQFFPTYKFTRDCSGSYNDSSSSRMVWDFTESEVDTVRNYYGSDSLMTTLIYDEYGNQTSITDPQGNTINYGYHIVGEGSPLNGAFLDSVYSPVYGTFNRMKYHTNSGAIEKQISANLDTTFFYYDSADRLIKTKRPLESTSYSTGKAYIDSDRAVIDSAKMNSAEYMKTKSVFNEFNWPIRTINWRQSDSIYSNIQYDNMGRILRVNRPHTSASDTIWTQYVYDGMGRNIQTIYPDGSRDSTIYNSRVTEIVDKLGRRKKSVLDSHMRLEKAYSDSAYQDSMRYEYGPWGKVIKETDARGLIKKYWYDKYGRLYSDSSDNGQKFYYYDKGNNLRLSRDSATDTLWRYVKYDGLGRQIEIGTKVNADTTQVNTSTYPTNGTFLIKYTYDDYSTGYKPTADSAHYNSLMNLTEIEDQTGKTWLYYDNRGRIYQKKVSINGLAGEKDIFYYYDDADQLNKLKYPDGTEVSYQYYKDGKLAEIPGFVEKSGSDFGIEYEPWGGLKSLTFFADTSYTDTYTYDNTSSRLTKIYSQKSGAKFWGQTYEYDTPGNITRSLGLDNNGSINSSDTAGYYTYDYNYLLIQGKVKSDTSSRVLSYEYDNNGNRTKATVNSTEIDYALKGTTSNQLDHLSTQSPGNYVYDKAGRLIADSASGKEYSYNAFGQLVKYIKDGNDRIYFTYDYSGHLVKKTVMYGNLCEHPDTCNSTTNVCDSIPVGDCDYVPGDVNNNGVLNGLDNTYLSNWIKGIGPAPTAPFSRSDANSSGSVNGIDVTYLTNYFKGYGPAPTCSYWDSSYHLTTYYIYSGDEVIAEYKDNGTLDWNYVYGLGQRLARFNGNTKHAFHNDHLGSLRALTDLSGNTVGKQDYYPFGEKLAITSDPGKYTYNGKEYLDDYGFDLYYYGARLMDAATGRFITPDPVKDYRNQYSYVGNNPVNRIDPTGMAASGFEYSIISPMDFDRPTYYSDLSDEEFYALTYDATKEALATRNKLYYLIRDVYKEADKKSKSGGDDSEFYAGMAEYFKGLLDHFADRVKTLEPDVMLSKPNVTFVYEHGEDGIDRLLYNPSLIRGSDTYLRSLLWHEGTHASYNKMHMGESDFLIQSENNARARGVQYYQKNSDYKSYSSFTSSSAIMRADPSIVIREANLIRLSNKLDKEFINPTDPSKMEDFLYWWDFYMGGKKY